MSVIYCEKHDRRWDSDYQENCPLCEPSQNQIREMKKCFKTSNQKLQQDFTDSINKFGAGLNQDQQEQCHYCKNYFPAPVSLHHSQDECSSPSRSESQREKEKSAVKQLANDIVDGILSEEK